MSEVSIARARQQRAGLATERGRQADIKELEAKSRRAARKQGRGRLQGLLGGLVAATIGNLLLPGLGGFAAKALFGALSGAGSFIGQGKQRVTSESPFLGLGEAAGDITRGLAQSRKATALEDVLTGINVRSAAGGLLKSLRGFAAGTPSGLGVGGTGAITNRLSNLGLRSLPRSF